jgi:hypothetical protein
MKICPRGFANLPNRLSGLTFLNQLTGRGLFFPGLALIATERIRPLSLASR